MRQLSLTPYNCGWFKSSSGPQGHAEISGIVRLQLETRPFQAAILTGRWSAQKPALDLSRTIQKSDLRGCVRQLSPF